MAEDAPLVLSTKDVRAVSPLVQDVPAVPLMIEDEREHIHSSSVSAWPLAWFRSERRRPAHHHHPPTISSRTGYASLPTLAGDGDVSSWAR
jgi:hypothetical protein